MFFYVEEKPEQNDYEDYEERRLQNIRAEAKKLFKARKDLKLPMNDYERKRLQNIGDMAKESSPKNRVILVMEFSVF